MNAIYEYFLREPRRLVELGRAMFTFSACLIVIGLAGYAARSGVSAFQHLGAATAAHAAPTLASLYPTFITWWIPESFAGTLPAMAVAGAGLGLVMLGRRLRALYF